MIIEYNIPSPVSARELNIFVRALTAYNVLWLRAHPETPDIYQSGVRYKEQPAGCEHFAPIPHVLAAGSGDCDQLAPWLAAQRRVRQGIKALPEVKQMGPKLFHVFVRYPDGSVEDVSARLGMAVPQHIVEKGQRILASQNARSSLSTAGVAVPWSPWVQTTFARSA